MIKQAGAKENLETGSFNRFVGILDDTFRTDDMKYNEIVKCTSNEFVDKYLCED